MRRQLIYGIILIILVVGGWLGFRNYQNSKYSKELTSLIDDMSGVGLRGTTICNGYSEAWHDAIYKEGSYAYGERHYGLSFSEAISVFHDDMKDPISSLNEDFEKIGASIKNMPSPHGKLSDAEDKVHECYKDLSQIISQVNSPTGSLIEFNKKVSELESSLAAQLQELKLY